MTSLSRCSLIRVLSFVLRLAVLVWMQRLADLRRHPGGWKGDRSHELRESHLSFCVPVWTRPSARLLPSRHFASPLAADLLLSISTGLHCDAIQIPDPVLPAASQLDQGGAQGEGSSPPSRPSFAPASPLVLEFPPALDHRSRFPFFLLLFCLHPTVRPEASALLESPDGSSPFLLALLPLSSFPSFLVLPLF